MELFVVQTLNQHDKEVAAGIAVLYDFFEDAIKYDIVVLGLIKNWLELDCHLAYRVFADAAEDVNDFQLSLTFYAFCFFFGSGLQKR